MCREDLASLSNEVDASHTMSYLAIGQNGASSLEQLYKEGGESELETEFGMAAVERDADVTGGVGGGVRPGPSEIGRHIGFWRTMRADVAVVVWPR